MIHGTVSLHSWYTGMLGVYAYIPLREGGWKIGEKPTDSGLNDDKTSVSMSNWVWKCAWVTLFKMDKILCTPESGTYQNRVLSLMIPYILTMTNFELLAV